MPKEDAKGEFSKAIVFFFHLAEALKRLTLKRKLEETEEEEGE